jgi:hypothetical protein
VSDLARPSLLVRIRHVTSPEMMAAALSVPVLAIALGLGTGALRIPSWVVIPSLTPPDIGFGGPTPSGQPSASPSPTTPSAAPTARTAWASEARVLLQADAGLMKVRDRLSTILADSPIDTSKVSRQLRAMNTTLSATFRLIDALESNGAPAKLIADVRAAHAAALRASLETLAGSLRNTAFYKAGTRDVIAALDDLEATMARLERAAEARPSPSP